MRFDDAGWCNRYIRDDVPAFAREFWGMLNVMAGRNQAGAICRKFESTFVLDARRTALSQGAVIIATSHAQSIATVVKCYQWHEYQIHICSR